MADQSSYKHTLSLPQTTFPMRANLAENEPKTLAFWEKIDLTAQLHQQNINCPKYTLHDGPPYANGHIHIGHALNKILKDIIVKTRNMSGYQAVFIPGWDCHGLPIEHQVDKELGRRRHQLTALEKRRICREYAQKFIDIQREEFIRLGVLGRWNTPYLTMTPAYEAGIVREFARFVKAGSVYRGVKPVYWCISCSTALAEAEVEYKDHASPSVYVTFPLALLSRKSLGLGSSASMVIWTTTPWTLPANLAVAVHPDYQYVAVRVGRRVFIVAQQLLASFLEVLGKPGKGEVMATFKGRELEGHNSQHPFLERRSGIILSHHVTLEQGTGCVHIAPGHGAEDYVLGQKYGLETYSPVDKRGNFHPEVPHFGGMSIFTANHAIVEKLRADGHLLSAEEIAHSYPHCWRCKRPVIFRATAQWFISMEQGDLRQKALEAVDKISWHPAWGRERIWGMLSNRPDWCISRQRIWGVPIMAFSCTSCGHMLLDPNIIEHIADKVAKDSSDVWFAKPASEFLPDGQTCSKCGGTDFEKTNDILDVWFESGVSHAVVLSENPELNYPADLYLEGSDQHRGWFHSALLTGLGARDIIPYRAALTHGFVVDGEGKKMSKTAGNVISPQEVIKKHGAELLRLWVAAEDYREDVRLSDEILKRLVEAYRRVRNTCRYLLGNLNDYNPKEHRVPYQELPEVDRWLLHQLQVLIRRVEKAYSDFSFHLVYHRLHNFCAVTLSAIYLDILKDRMYCSAPDAKERRAGQMVMLEALLTLIRLFAPVLSFTAEEVWQHLPQAVRDVPSVHLAPFPKVKTEWLDEKLSKRWEQLLCLRSGVCKALELARAQKIIGSGLAAEISLSLTPTLAQLAGSYRSEDLAALFIVSGVSLEDIPLQSESYALVIGNAELADIPELKGCVIGVSRAKGGKCSRCWMYHLQVGQIPSHPELCPRCAEVLRQAETSI